MGNVDNVKQYSASNPPPYPVTSVNGETGNVTLDASDVGARSNTWMPTKSDIGLGNVGNFKAVSTVASQGLTDTEKSNARTNIGAGTYSKPSTGIPKSDLASSVQTSLGKADTALQSHQDISGKAEKINGVYYGVCDTAQATKAKVVTLTNGTGFTLTTGAMVAIKFTNASAASTMTLNVNSTGAKNIYQYGTTAASSDTTTNGWIAGAMVFFVYDGTGWVRIYWSNSTYSVMTVEEGTTGTATTSRTVSAANLKAIIEAHSSGGSNILKFQDVNVPTSAWVADATYENYAYRASVVLNGVTSAMCPQVYFSMELIETPDVTYAPISETYNGGVYIYASEVPSSSIVIPSIVCM